VLGATAVAGHTAGMPTVEVVSIAERPELAPAAATLGLSWPVFMQQDTTAAMLGLLGRFPAHQLVLLADGSPVARAHSVPFHWDGEPASLPDTGWDEVLGRGVSGAEHGRPATAVSALEIAIVPEWQSRGLSPVLVRALRDAAAAAGYADLVAPVRPSQKAAEPALPMAEYVRRSRPDGLPADPWLRVHARLGATVIKVCPASMVVAGSLAQWREWTGLPFDRDEPVTVPGALAPVHVSLAHDHAVYVEANVWMRHRLR
jgi:GNAT superfamily N-acetyltransferase